jgi:uncharacterized glyoxalase superfamily protein PhnB
MATKKKASSKPKQAKRQQSVTPYLLYSDVAAALAWLKKAFDFEEHGDRFNGPDGKVAHAAMQLTGGGDLFMLGCPHKGYRNPKQLGMATQLQYVNVKDIDRHFARAKKAGAKILEEPNDTFYGDRRYGAEDPEGHQWYFAEHVRDVSPAEMKKAMQKKKAAH